MSKFECICCGAPLQVTTANETVKCQYCGLEQSVPLTDLKTANLFQKADQQRRYQQYDEAMETYNSILKLNPDSAEAYWQMCLCRYGVDFVVDPPTGRAMPTCNRMNQELITADVDFKQACALAPALIQDYYRKTANYIAQIQQNYFILKKSVKPYDVFICYKDSNEDGSRTRDSIHAERIYEELTNEGYRVFFSRRSLQEVSGQQYEGHIFMALSNARVLILLSSKAEYVETPWMKNEWTRYLYQISQDAHKKLLLLYRDLDPAELPSQLSKLQGLDMRRWNFMDTLKEKLKEIFDLKANEQKEEEVEGDGEYQTLLNRAQTAMQEKKYDTAQECYETLLDYLPESADFYWNLYQAKRNGKVKCSAEQEIPFDLRMAFRFGNEEEKKVYSEKTGISAELALKPVKKEKISANKAYAVREKENGRMLEQRDRELSAAEKKITAIHENRMASFRNGFRDEKIALEKIIAGKSQEFGERDQNYYAFKLPGHLLFLIALIVYCVLHKVTFAAEDIITLAVLLGTPVLMFFVWMFYLSGAGVGLPGILSIGCIPILVHIATGFRGLIFWNTEQMIVSVYTFIFIQFLLYLILFFRQAADCEAVKRRLTSFESKRRLVKDSLEQTQKAWKEEFERINRRYSGLPEAQWKELRNLSFQNEEFGSFSGPFSRAGAYGKSLFAKKVIILICCILVCLAAAI